MYGSVDLGAAREHLISRLGGIVDDRPDRPRPTTLVGMADQIMRIIEQEGREHVIETAKILMSSSDWGMTGDSLDKRWAAVKQWATDLLIQGADDAWSGRTNDIRRAYFDGVRDECRRILSWDDMEDYL